MTGPSPTRSAPVAIRWWLLGGWLALVAFHIWIARGVTGPIVLQDESGYLGNARWLIGASPVPEMGEQPVYAWGYSVVIAPLVALIDDPSTLYRSVQVLNAALLSSLLPLLWILLRRVGEVEPRRAAMAALAGSVFPATLVHSSVAWAESLLPVLLVSIVLAVWWTLTERPGWQRMLVGPLVVAGYATHPRMLPAVGVVAIGLIVMGFTRRVPRGVAAFGVAAIGVGVAGVRIVNAALIDTRWPDRMAGEGSESRLLARLFNPLNWPEILAGSIGQGWYLAAASLGLAVAGTITIVTWIRRGDGRDPARLAIACSAVLGLALFVTSVVSFVGTAERVDHLIYGRYNEAFTPMLVAAGVAGLLTLGGASRRRLAAASAMATGAMGMVLLLWRRPGAFTGEIVWNNTLGLRPVVELVGQRWMVPAATIGAMMALTGFWLAANRVRVTVTAHGAAIAAFVISGAVAVTPLADFADSRYRGWDLPEHLARVVSVAEVDMVGLERDATGLMASLGYPYWLPSTRFDLVGRPDADPPGLVVSAIDAGLEDDHDAQIVVLDARNQQAVWVIGGTEAHDRLADRGALLPRGFPSELSASAQHAELELAPGTSSIAVAAGGSVEVEVEVLHAGDGGAWPSDAEWPLPGVVRLGARWIDDRGAEVRSADRGALPHPMWPGDRATSTIRIEAVDADGMPLPTGTYEVVIDLVQEGFTWFDSPDAASVTVVVGPG